MVTLQLELSPKMESLLTKMQETAGLNSDELLKLAISVLAVHMRAISEGHEIVIRDMEGKKRRFALKITLKGPFPT